MTREEKIILADSLYKQFRDMEENIRSTTGLEDSLPIVEQKKRMYKLMLMELDDGKRT
jgi:hypothetical protein